MTQRIRSVLVLVALGTLGLLVAVFHPSAQEVEDTEPPAVGEKDVEMYIKVYGAMQDNHDLTIDAAIAPYQVSLDDFRQIERRLQTQPRLVERVRQALLEHAKAHSVVAQAVASPTAEVISATPKPHAKKKKKK